MKGEIPAFRAWTKEILPQLARHPGTPNSVRVIPSRERSDTASIRGQWEWFAYLVKQLPPEVPCGNRSSGQPFMPLREFLKPGRRTWPYRRLADVSCRKLVGSSHDLSQKAQKDAGFRSWLLWSRRDRLFEGWELESWRKWQRQKALAEMFRGLDTGHHPLPTTRSTRPDE